MIDLLIQKCVVWDHVFSDSDAYFGEFACVDYFHFVWHYQLVEGVCAYQDLEEVLR